jgi:putative membrane protein
MALDLRQHLALERTLLAYIRTGLALIGIGFVIARFGWLMREFGIQSAAPGHLSLWFGTVLVLAGGISGLLSASVYRQQLARLNAVLQMDEKPSWLGVGMSLTLALIGIAIAIYLLISGIGIA